MIQLDLIGWAVVGLSLAGQVAATRHLHRAIKRRGARRGLLMAVWTQPLAASFFVVATLFGAIPPIAAAAPAIGLFLALQWPDGLIWMTGGPDPVVQVASAISAIRRECLALEREQHYEREEARVSNIRDLMRRLEKVRPPELRDFVDDYVRVVGRWLNGDRMTEESARLARIDDYQATLAAELRRRGVDLALLDKQ